MILADSSAWIEYFRRTGSAVNGRVRLLIESGQPPATTEIILLEVMAGARDISNRDRLRRTLLQGSLVPAESPGDYLSAADVYRTCRAAGETICKTTDCLIAVVAMRAGAALLHRDRDFDAIARHVPLAIDRD